MEKLDTIPVDKVVKEVLAVTAQFKTASERASKLMGALQKETDSLKFNAVSITTEAEGQLSLYRGE